MKMQRSQGFSLIEIAVVIVIIAVLIAGVLKGKEILDQSKLLAQVGQFQKIRQALILFHDKYKTLPGDVTINECSALGWGSPCSSVTTRTSNTTNQYSWLQLYEGTEGVMDTGQFEANTSTKRLLTKYSKNRVLQFVNSTTISYFGKTVNNYMRIQHFPSTGFNGFTSASRVRFIDSKIDDGKANSGFMFAIDAGAPGSCSAWWNVIGGADYGPSLGDDNEHGCQVAIFVDDMLKQGL